MVWLHPWRELARLVGIAAARSHRALVSMRNVLAGTATIKQGSRTTSKQGRHALAPARAGRRRIGLRDENCHGQVISGAPLVGKIDEPPAGCGSLDATDYFPEFVVFDHAIEAIAAHQKLVVLFQRQRDSIDCHY